MVHTELNSEESFKNALSTQGKYVLIYAHEDGVSDVAEKYSEQNADKVDSYQVDLTKNPHVKHIMAMESWPTVVVFKDGQEVKRAVGAKPEDMQAIGALFA
ncbi:hypothetical protein CLAFUW4_02328 [Fulvia fulva]|uniref:Thioredoxin domain-containing protein n=1 Tax=Passalora fulva TaxID=5499 RepID=A0A9Q8L8W2_PASFU|nr:uncharacterized protein CLAFUR5_02317 [Fulvia fulva]KAK4634339.1 hypothetical protein CLAFUR4_02323 [Fulvia fulva]KAK4637119.1 hypothetical protein CLAFUR0_02327 [Fulvia fulva]UJO12997.1 hypothetical protein CLAFUR5_02317 [Fulvia fulva]WPV10285.1 hypothetical protein CLAFUW4_02328 [Fulvia fulva]WPV24008.1 hypothetical protein CLAFUW7_02328 [Fulvia fulva]